MSLSLVLMSIPIMVTIPFMLWAFCLKLSWLPCSGWGGFWDVRIIIPAITMGIPGVAGLARLMRASTLDVMGQDFIRTARRRVCPRWWWTRGTCSRTRSFRWSR